MKFDKPYLIKLGKRLLNSLWIAVALLCVFFIGHYSYIINNTDKPKHAAKTTKDVTIAINNANEIMIIDRKTGTYQTYSDSVGISIFKMYASKMYQSVSEK